MAPLVRSLDLYQLVPDCWYDFVEMSPVYPKANPMIYMYFVSSTLMDTGVRSRTLDAIEVSKYARKALPKVISVVQWVQPSS